MPKNPVDLFDNSPSKVAIRLLEVLPLEVLRKEFDVKGDTQDVTEAIIAKATVADVKADCMRLMGHCRQHIYLFRHPLKKGHLPTGFFGDNVEEKNVVEETPECVDHEYLLRLKYEFVEVISETAKRRWLTLWWPVRVIVKPGVLQIRITIMERNTKLAKNIYFHERTIDDAGIVLSVKAGFGASVSVEQLDFNKGVKALWSTPSKIDSSFAAHKTATSIDSSEMDSGFSIKKDAPDKFKKMLAEPLRKSVFISEEAALPYAFATEPCEGRISVRRYSEDSEAVGKLIEEILKLN